ncbi:MAG: translation initiation factor IF-3 [Anaerolineae bacterium]
MSEKSYRVNRQIRVSPVRLIDADGENRGVVPLEEAKQAAISTNLDLVEVAPNANPPVVKVMDYGKFKYEQEKAAQQARKSQKVIQVKEIQLRPKTADHHRDFKVRRARGWLEEGKKVKVRMRFRGREITYPEIGREKLRGIAEELSDVSEVEQSPSMDRYSMLMVLTPSDD